MGTGPFPGVKRPGRDVDHLPPPSAKVKERVELYLYSTSGLSWPLLYFYILLLPITKYYIKILNGVAFVNLTPQNFAILHGVTADCGRLEVPYLCGLLC